MKIIALMAGAALLVAPSATFADEYEDQVRAQIAGAALRVLDDGWELDRDIYLDRLNENAVDYLTFTLSDADGYAIMAVCDADCGDIDLTLLDQYDNVVDEDTTEDDVPVVTVEPGRTADYVVKVRMYHCSAEPCRYGVAIFSD